jgi:hypothetical protein
MLARDKHSSLLGTFVNYGLKMFYNNIPRLDLFTSLLKNPPSRRPPLNLPNPQEPNYKTLQISSQQTQNIVIYTCKKFYGAVALVSVDVVVVVVSVEPGKGGMLFVEGTHVEAPK